MSCHFPLQPRHVDGVLYVDFYGISTVNIYEQVHFKQNMEEFYNSQTPPSEGPGSISTNTLSRILPTPYFELLGKEEHG